MKRDYHNEATSIEGYVQQMVRYVSAGYRYYVFGRIGPRKSAEQVDQALIEKFSIAKSPNQRARAKARGEANIQYLRFQNCWVMIATKGRHRWMEAHIDKNGKRLFSDVRQKALIAGPYAISSKLDGQWKPGQLKRYRTRVTLSREEGKALEALYTQKACHWSKERLENELRQLGQIYLPYAPVRGQLVQLVKKMNRRRKQMGYSRIPYSSLEMPAFARSRKVFS